RLSPAARRGDAGDRIAARDRERGGRDRRARHLRRLLRARRRKRRGGSRLAAARRRNGDPMTGLGPGGSSDSFFDSRLRVLGVRRIAVLALSLVRLFQLQVVEGEQHLQNSLRNSIRTIRLAAPRGEILDREGRVLATTRPAFDLDVVPSELRNADRTIDVLSVL